MMMGVTQNSKLMITSVSLLALTLLACRHAEKRMTPPPPTSGSFDPPPAQVSAPVLERAMRFDHNQTEHKKQLCRQCHQRDDQRPMDPTPEYPYHDACVKCHAKEDFLKMPAARPLCLVCHSGGEPPGAQETARLAVFPKKSDQFGLKRFSHQTHLDPNKMLTGAPRPRCDSCHRLERELSEVSFPRHPECYRCHIHSAGQKLGDCGDCHLEVGAAMKFDPSAGAAYRLYNFRHGSHLKQATVHSDCRVCHQMIEPLGEAPQSDIIRISTARGQRHQSACWKCHLQSREPVCTKCHLSGPPA